jgi:hypothetical protein
MTGYCSSSRINISWQQLYIVVRWPFLIEPIFLFVQIILFQFGLGSNAHFIILELYAQGNILLMDSEYTVMTLLRSHRLLPD